MNTSQYKITGTAHGRPWIFSGMHGFMDDMGNWIFMRKIGPAGFMRRVYE